jgi:predicted TIM-barrel fold metal-dependent hydrolase
MSISELPLIDHHCHGIVPGDLDRLAFEDLINEGLDPPAAGTSHFDTPVGLAVRRWCAPVLDLEPFATPEAYLERRSGLGAGEANRRLLRAAGVGAMLLDSAYQAGHVLGTAEMGSLAGVHAYDIARLEAVAEAVASEGVDASAYPDAYVRKLEESARGAVGLKTIVAYRHPRGFDFDPKAPSRQEVVDAVGRWMRESGDGPFRLEEPVLLRYGLWAGADLARRRGFPIQIHAGFGDTDLTLHLANPSLLTDLVRDFRDLGVNVVFLHCYPYHREAAYLAAVFPNVSLDLGSVLHYTGPSAGDVLAETMALAPFTGHLYSSDAFGVAEFHYLGAILFRRGLRSVLEEWVRRDECSTQEADRIAQQAASGNARRIYPLAND